MVRAEVLIGRARRRFFFGLATLWICFMLLATRGQSAQSRSVKIKTGNANAPVATFHYYKPRGLSIKKGEPVNVLVLVGGLGGDGRYFMSSKWRRHATQHKLLLVAPTYKFHMGDFRAGKSYQYPSAWSGKALLDGLARIAPEAKLRLSLFGFSAGAQFSHRFALWKPELVAGAFSHAAGGYTRPTRTIGTKLLITAGEKDEQRAHMARQFHAACETLKIPAKLTIYPGLAHEMKQEQIDAGLAFLKEARKKAD